MASNSISRIFLVAIILSVFAAALGQQPARAAAAADLTVTQQPIIFYLDPSLLTDMQFAQTVLPKYVADMNSVLGKNTRRQLVFDPQAGIISTNTRPQTDSAASPLPTEGFAIWANAMKSQYSTSYGGYAGVDVSGAGVLAGMYWTRLYDPDALTTAAAAQDYVIQIDNMLHELAHVYGAGIGEYYSLAHVNDTTLSDPLLNISVTAPGDPYWSDKQDFFGDPLLELNRPSNRTQYLVAARYSDLTAAILNGDYRNGVSSFDHFTVQVVDRNGQPVPSAEVKVWSVSGRRPYASGLLQVGTTDETGQLTLDAGWSRNADNLLRLIKVYVNGAPYTPARYVSIFDADIAQLVRGQDSMLVVLQEINQPPTDITLTNSAIDENQPAGTFVGELAAVDADAGETFTYRFCGGAGDQSFQIAGSQLLSALKFDYEQQKSYSVCLEADDGRGGVLDKAITIQVNDLPDTATVILPAMGANDGWVLERAKGANVGAAWNSTNASLLIGNDASARRYRSVLAFNTSRVPAGAIITKMTLKVRRQGAVGTPFVSLGKLVVDAGQPLIGSLPGMQSTDFQAAVGVQSAAVAGPGVDSQGWYGVGLSQAAYGLVKSGGVMELRLRFSGLSSAGASYLALYSGNAVSANRPVLIIQYELP